MTLEKVELGMRCPRCRSFQVAFTGVIDRGNLDEIWVCWECEYEGYVWEFMLI